LPDVHSGEQFGLVSSDYTSPFKGLLEIKEEYKEDDEFDLSSFDDSSLAQTFNIQKPALPKLPHYISSISDTVTSALSHLNIVSKFDMDFYLQYSSIDLFNGYRYSGLLRTWTKNISFEIVCNDVKLRIGGRAAEEED
jgi:hypothetical protein